MKLVRSLIGIGMCAMVSLVGSNTVFGQTSADDRAAGGAGVKN